MWWKYSAGPSTDLNSLFIQPAGFHIAQWDFNFFFFFRWDSHKWILWRILITHYNEMVKSYTTAERITISMQNHTNDINVVKYFNVYLHK